MQDPTYLVPLAGALEVSVIHCATLMRYMIFHKKICKISGLYKQA